MCATQLFECHFKVNLKSNSLSFEFSLETFNIYMNCEESSFFFRLLRYTTDLPQGGTVIQEMPCIAFPLLANSLTFSDSLP